MRVLATALLMGAVLIPHWETSSHITLAISCLVSLYWLAEAWKVQEKIVLPRAVEVLFTERANPYNVRC